MLVEGGYLHSMKQIIDKAAETPDFADDPNRIPAPSTKPGGALVRSLRRLSLLLLGWDFRN
jgi:hypothetical protein